MMRMVFCSSTPTWRAPCSFLNCTSNMNSLLSAVIPAQAGIHRTHAQYGFPPVRERRLVRVARHGGTAVTDQEIEVAAFVGLQHVLDVQLLVASLRTRCAALHSDSLAC